MILPTMLYWGAVIIIGINFGHTKLQHFIAVASTIALIIAYTLFKEIFRKRVARVSDAHFILLSYIKLYASWLMYAATLGIIWYYCFPPILFYTLSFLVTFMLLYQALFQFCGIKREYITKILGISLVIAVMSYFVYDYWNVNYFSAGLFLTAVYNFLWSLLYYSIKKTLTLNTLFEVVAIFILILIMVFGVTNFKAKIERCNDVPFVATLQRV